jgi:periplasmic protein TonB
MSALPSAEARLRRATVLVVIFALHVLLAMLLADALTHRPQARTVTAIEVSLVGESLPPPSPPDAPSPDRQQLAQVQVTVPELMLELPVEAPPISAAVIEPVRTNTELPSSPPASTGVVEPVRTRIELLSSLAISAYYPPQSLKLKEQGTVTNAFCVDADGKVVSVQLDRSSGYKRLDEAALRLTRNSRWRAGTQNGRPVLSCALHSLRFFLTQP